VASPRDLNQLYYWQHAYNPQGENVSTSNQDLNTNILLCQERLYYAGARRRKVLSLV